MSRFHIWMMAIALGGAAAPVWGQGLYGAPEMVQLNPPSNPLSSPYGYLGSQNGYAGGEAQSTIPHRTYSQYSRSPTVSANPPMASRPGWSGSTPAQPSAYSRNDDPGYANHSGGPVSPQAASVSNGALGSMTPEPMGSQPSPNLGGPMVGESNGGFGGSACGNLWSGPACGWEDPQCFRPMWYVAGNGLMMTRNDPNGVATTYKTGTFPNTMLMQTTDAEVDWRGGYEAKVGWRFGPQRRWAIEGGYWAVDGFWGGQGFAASSLVPFNTLSTPLVVNGIEFAGVNGDYFFNAAAEHRLWRKNQVQNAEVSLVGWFGGGDPSSCAPFDIAVMAGPRYFVFQEELGFGSLAFGGSWGGIDEAYLRDRIINTLIGGQIGFDAGCHLGNMFRIYVAPKFGIYNNHIVNNFIAVRGDGTVATPTAASGVTGTYPVVADKDVFSCITQVDAGVEWKFHPQWSAFIAYRLVAATGIGLADHQIPANIVDIPALSVVKHNGDLLLHGSLAGIKAEF